MRNRDPIDDKIRYGGSGRYGFGQNDIGAVSVDIGKAMLSRMVDADDIFDGPKITILGCGKRAGAIAFMLLTKGAASEVVMFDVCGSNYDIKEEDEEEEIDEGNKKNVNKQNANVATVKDLETCSLYYPSSAKITMGLDIEDIAGSMIYIITSDFASMKTTFSLSATATNANISKLKENLKFISQNSRPDSIIINATEPGDLMTYAIWRWSGFDHQRVFGLGTSLASSHLKNEMAFAYNTAPEFCDVVLSGISTKPNLLHHSFAFCGTKISEIATNLDQDIEDNDEFWEEAATSGALANKVIQDLTGRDQSSIWGAAAIISKMVDSIVNNSGELFNVCIHIRGCRHGNKKDVYLSLPAIIGRRGVRYIVKQKMEDADKASMQEYANLVFNIYPKLDLPGQMPMRGDISKENSWIESEKLKRKKASKLSSNSDSDTCSCLLKEEDLSGEIPEESRSAQAGDFLSSPCLCVDTSNGTNLLDESSPFACACLDSATKEPDEYRDICTRLDASSLPMCTPTEAAIESTKTFKSLTNGSSEDAKNVSEETAMKDRIFEKSVESTKPDGSLGSICTCPDKSDGSAGEAILDSSAMKKTDGSLDSVCTCLESLEPTMEDTIYKKSAKPDLVKDAATKESVKSAPGDKSSSICECLDSKDKTEGTTILNISTKSAQKSNISSEVIKVESICSCPEYSPISSGEISSATGESTAESIEESINSSPMSTGTEATTASSETSKSLTNGSSDYSENVSEKAADTESSTRDTICSCSESTINGSSRERISSTDTEIIDTESSTQETICSCSESTINGSSRERISSTDTEIIDTESSTQETICSCSESTINGYSRKKISSTDTEIIDTESSIQETICSCSENTINRSSREKTSTVSSGTSGRSDSTYTGTIENVHSRRLEQSENSEISLESGQFSKKLGDVSGDTFVASEASTFDDNGITDFKTYGNKVNQSPSKSNGPYISHLSAADNPQKKSKILSKLSDKAIEQTPGTLKVDSLQNGEATNSHQTSKGPEESSKQAPSEPKEILDKTESQNDISEKPSNKTNCLCDPESYVKKLRKAKNASVQTSNKFRSDYEQDGNSSNKKKLDETEIASAKEYKDNAFQSIEKYSESLKDLFDKDLCPCEFGKRMSGGPNINSIKDQELKEPGQLADKPYESASKTDRLNKSDPSTADGSQKESKMSSKLSDKLNEQIPSALEIDLLRNGEVKDSQQSSKVLEESTKQATSESEEILSIRSDNNHLDKTESENDGSEKPVNKSNCPCDPECYVKKLRKAKNASVQTSNKLRNDYEQNGSSSNKEKLDETETASVKEYKDNAFQSIEKYSESLKDLFDENLCPCELSKQIPGGSNINSMKDDELKESGQLSENSYESPSKSDGLDKSDSPIAFNSQKESKISSKLSDKPSDLNVGALQNGAVKHSQQSSKATKEIPSKAGANKSAIKDEELKEPGQLSQKLSRISEKSLVETPSKQRLNQSQVSFKDNEEEEGISNEFNVGTKKIISDVSSENINRDVGITDKSEDKRKKNTNVESMMQATTEKSSGIKVKQETTSKPCPKNKTCVCKHECKVNKSQPTTKSKKSSLTPEESYYVEEDEGEKKISKPCPKNKSCVCEPECRPKAKKSRSKNKSRERSVTPDKSITQEERKATSKPCPKNSSCVCEPECKPRLKQSRSSSKSKKKDKIAEEKRSASISTPDIYATSTTRSDIIPSSIISENSEQMHPDKKKSHSESEESDDKVPKKTISRKCPCEPECHRKRLRKTRSTSKEPPKKLEKYSADTDYESSSDEKTNGDSKDQSSTDTSTDYESSSDDLEPRNDMEPTNLSNKSLRDKKSQVSNKVPIKPRSSQPEKGMAVMEMYGDSCICGEEELSKKIETPRKGCCSDKQCTCQGTVGKCTCLEKVMEFIKKKKLAKGLKDGEELSGNKIDDIQDTKSLPSSKKISAMPSDSIGRDGKKDKNQKPYTKNDICVCGPECEATEIKSSRTSRHSIGESIEMSKSCSKDDSCDCTECKPKAKKSRSSSKSKKKDKIAEEKRFESTATRKPVDKSLKHTEVSKEIENESQVIAKDVHDIDNCICEPREQQIAKLSSRMVKKSVIPNEPEKSKLMDEFRDFEGEIRTIPKKVKESKTCVCEPERYSKKKDDTAEEKKQKKNSGHKEWEKESFASEEFIEPEKNKYFKKSEQKDKHPQKSSKKTAELEDSDQDKSATKSKRRQSQDKEKKKETTSKEPKNAEETTAKPSKKSGVCECQSCDAKRSKKDGSTKEKKSQRSSSVSKESTSTDEDIGSEESDHKSSTESENTEHTGNQRVCCPCEKSGSEKSGKDSENNKSTTETEITERAEKEKYDGCTCGPECHAKKVKKDDLANEKKYSCKPEKTSVNREKSTKTKKIDQATSKKTKKLADESNKEETNQKPSPSNVCCPCEKSASEKSGEESENNKSITETEITEKENRAEKEKYDGCTCGPECHAKKLKKDDLANEKKCKPEKTPDIREKSTKTKKTSPKKTEKQADVSNKEESNQKPCQSSNVCSSCGKKSGEGSENNKRGETKKPITPSNKSNKKTDEIDSCKTKRRSEDKKSCSEKTMKEEKPKSKRKPTDDESTLEANKNVEIIAKKISRKPSLESGTSSLESETDSDEIPKETSKNAKCICEPIRRKSKSRKAEINKISEKSIKPEENLQPPCCDDPGCICGKGIPDVLEGSATLEQKAHKSSKSMKKQFEKFKKNEAKIESQQSLSAGSCICGQVISFNINNEVRLVYENISNGCICQECIGDRMEEINEPTEPNKPTILNKLFSQDREISINNDECMCSIEVPDISQENIKISEKPIKEENNEHNSQFKKTKGYSDKENESEDSIVCVSDDVCVCEDLSRNPRASRKTTTPVQKKGRDVPEDDNEIKHSKSKKSSRNSSSSSEKENKESSNENYIYKQTDKPIKSPRSLRKPKKESADSNKAPKDERVITNKLINKIDPSSEDENIIKTSFKECEIYESCICHENKSKEIKESKSEKKHYVKNIAEATGNRHRTSKKHPDKIDKHLNADEANDLKGNEKICVSGEICVCPENIPEEMRKPKKSPRSSSISEDDHVPSKKLSIMIGECKSSESCVCEENVTARAVSRLEEPLSEKKKIDSGGRPKRSRKSKEEEGRNHSASKNRSNKSRKHADDSEDEGRGPKLIISNESCICSECITDKSDHKERSKETNKMRKSNHPEQPKSAIIECEPGTICGCLNQSEISTFPMREMNSQAPIQKLLDSKETDSSDLTKPSKIIECEPGVICSCAYNSTDASELNPSKDTAANIENSHDSKPEKDTKIYRCSCPRTPSKKSGSKILYEHTF